MPLDTPLTFPCTTSPTFWYTPTPKSSPQSTVALYTPAFSSTTSTYNPNPSYPATNSLPSTTTSAAPPGGVSVKLIWSGFKLTEERGFENWSLGRRVIKAGVPAVVVAIVGEEAATSGASGVMVIYGVASRVGVGEVEVGMDFMDRV